jgi:putative YphP/YqiW family bacilliredoxin
MQFGFGVGPDTSWMRKELTDVGVEELKTPEDVDKAMKEYNTGTMLMAINSVCGCAAGNARPGLAIALEKAGQNLTIW